MIMMRSGLGPERVSCEVVGQRMGSPERRDADWPGGLDHHLAGGVAASVGRSARGGRGPVRPGDPGPRQGGGGRDGKQGPRPWWRNPAWERAVFTAACLIVIFALIVLAGAR